MTIDVIDQPSDLEQLRSAWLDLEERDGHSVIGSWKFVSIWCRYRLGNDKAHILVFREGSECVGIAPLMVASRRIGPVRVPTILYMTRNGFVPGARIIARRERAVAVARAMLEYLSHRDRAWSVIRLNNILPDGALDQVIRESVLDQSLLAHYESPNSTATLHFDGKWDEVFARFSGDRRRTVSKKYRALEKTAEVTNSCITDPSAIPAALESCFDIASRTWQGEAGSCIASSESSRSFYRALFESFAQTNRARIQVLSVGQRPISFELALADRGCHHSLKIGFDGEYRRFAPGILTIAAAFRAALERGDRRAELFHPTTRAKSAWGITPIPLQHATVYTSSLTGRLLHAARRTRSSDPPIPVPA